VIALGLRSNAGERVSSAAVASALFVASAVRPPIAALSLPTAIEALRERRWLSFGLVAGACIAAAAWITAIVSSMTDLRCGHVGSAGSKLREFAVHWPALVAQGFAQHGTYYFVSFVGHFGWGDARTGIIGPPLPAWVYLAALPILAVAICRDLFSPAPVGAVQRIALAASALGAALLTFFAMYVSCTPTGASDIGGVQGRYFVPVLIALGPAIGGLFSEGRSVDLDRAYVALVISWVVACTALMAIASHQLYVR
jgi:uncharacterized membrane protein